MSSFPEGKLLWKPTSKRKEEANITHYMRWLQEEKKLEFGSYNDLWKWSVTDIEGFWKSLWDYFKIKASKPYTKVLSARKMPGASWFTESELNYAEHIFRNSVPEKPAIIFQRNENSLIEITWKELYDKISAVASFLRNMGVKRGDRVVAYLPNIPEAIMAFLASASLGAIWSSCSPDFGSSSVIDRFKQIEPKILFAVDGYRYNGKPFNRMEIVANIQAALPTLQKTIVIPYLSGNPETNHLRNAVTWDEILGRHSNLLFEPVPFDHPLWVLYSSGTTGLPKAITHGHGGIVVEHLKALSLHCDLKPNDRFFWFTTTGWMMWNYLVGGLLTGATIVLYDESPAYPNMNVLWDLAENGELTYFGTSGAYIDACIKAGIAPVDSHDLTKLEGIGSTGSPLSTDGFKWIYDRVKKDLWLFSLSGGTDVCTIFVGGCPLLPVHSGEIQCRSLGAKVEAFNEQGQNVTGEVGELVVIEPMPSMPIFFWGDTDNKRYKESYFETFPGVWRHGDWIKVTTRGSCVIFGRSDATIKRFGIRMGTSEIYRAVEALPEVVDSLVVDLEALGGKSYMPLFVVLKSGLTLDISIKQKIKEKIRHDLSPRHVPDEIFSIPEVPRTLNGKKLEVPVRKILLGIQPEKAVNIDSLSNPDSIKYFIDLAEELRTKT